MRGFIYIKENRKTSSCGVGGGRLLKAPAVVGSALGFPDFLVGAAARIRRSPEEIPPVVRWKRKEIVKKILREFMLMLAGR